MAVDGRLTPSQLRAYEMVEDLCRRAAIEIEKLDCAGVPCDQEKERIAHLLQACDGIKALHQRIIDQQGG